MGDTLKPNQIPTREQGIELFEVEGHVFHLFYVDKGKSFRVDIRKDGESCPSFAASQRWQALFEAKEWVLDQLEKGGKE